MEAEHAHGRARRQKLIMWRLTGESDDGALQGAREGESDGSSRCPGGDRPRSAPRGLSVVLELC